MATAARAVEYPHIVKTPGVRGGKARIDGTRICVVDVAIAYQQGHKPEEIQTSTDHHHLQIADRWLRAEKPFRMVWWKQAPYQHVRPHAFLDAFDEMAAQVDDPFRYPVHCLKPRA
jgi:uncharacterized protein (DUF433 family)